MNGRPRGFRAGPLHNFLIGKQDKTGLGCGIFIKMGAIMNIKHKSLIVIATIAAIGTAALAGGHTASDAEKAMKARKAHMQLFSFNLGPLGAMAQEKIPYDAETAATTAANLAAIAAISQAGYWIEGTDSSVEGSRAKPEIWTDMAGFEQDNADLAAASVALAAVAGDGLDALKGAFGPVGQACGACHEDYRTPRN